MGKREATHARLLSLAADYVYRHGITGTGVNALSGALDVTKPTLYDHFGSKEELIHEVVCLRDQMRRDSFRKMLQSLAGSPRQKVLGIFDWFHQWAQEEDFLGCALVKAIVESPSPSRRDRKIAKDHKVWIRKELVDFVEKLGYRDSGELAEALHFLIEGSVLSAYMESNPDLILSAKAVAERLLATHTA